MHSTIYTNGMYLTNNPVWHADDSPWKARHVAGLLARHGLAPATVCEIGCGAGEVLKSLGEHLAPGTRYFGYDISPQAYSICSKKQGGDYTFRHANLLEEEDAHYDVALAIDVFEHVEDYFSFLRKLRTKARHKVFHIPLDLSALSVMRSRPLIDMWRSVGHIHQFTKDTALAALADTGYKVLDWTYTSGRTDLPGLSWKTRLLKVPRRFLYSASPDAAARILGGYSLLVLAE